MPNVVASRVVGSNYFYSELLGTSFTLSGRRALCLSTGDSRAGRGVRLSSSVAVVIHLPMSGSVTIFSGAVNSSMTMYGDPISWMIYMISHSIVKELNGMAIGIIVS